MNKEMLMTQVANRLQEAHEMQVALEQVQWFVRNMNPANAEAIKHELRAPILKELGTAKTISGRINREITGYIKLREKEQAQ